MTPSRHAPVRTAAAAVLALVLLGCGAREGITPDPTPGDDATAPATPEDGSSQDGPSEGGSTVPTPEPPDEVAPPPEPTPEPGPAPPPSEPTEVAVPAEIAAVFTLPSQVRVDDAGTSDGDGDTAVVQLTGEFVGGDLAAAAAAFDAALRDAGVGAAQEPSPEGVVFVAPLERATLAIALLADDGRTFVSVDLLVDRTA